jgi:4-diphosphocytidyl-2-C-methyl-D-erythritol kinase
VNSAPSRVEASCPGKVNLSLRVLGRYPDGYHEIRTVFQAVDLCDTLEVRVATELSLSCDVPGLPTDASNLVLRAATLLADRFGIGAGAAMRLHKRIPVGGGMGGGSSDAAGALLALSELWGIGAGTGELLPLAARLGADVPFFLHGGTALGEGRGDRVTRLPFAGPLHLLLGLPPFGVSTAEAYARVRSDLTLEAKDVSVKFLSDGNLSSEGEPLSCINDLEAGVFERWPGLQSFRDGLLRGGARTALLSGSGSTVFGVFDDSGSLPRATRDLAARFPDWRLLGVRAVPDAAHVVGAGGPI